MKVFVSIFALLALAQAAILPYNDNSRIVGGQVAAPNQFPYQVGLNMSFPDGSHHFCGGSLISKRYVLTAAHCADQAKSIEVVMGALKVKEHEPNQQRQVSTEFHVHEQWDPRPHHIVNDIALLKLPKDIQITASVQPMKLPTRSDAKNDFSGFDAITSGWGKDSDAATSTTDYLNYLPSVIISNAECAQTFTSGVLSTMICAKGKKEHQSTCQGDSGGPLVVNRGGVTRQVGVFSWLADAGCEKSLPFTFTRVTDYLDWIGKNSDVTIDP